MSKMNPYERVMACIAGETPDKVPVIPIVREWASKQAGFRFSELMESAQKHVYSQFYCVNRFGYDAVFDLSGIHAEAEAMGSKVKYGENILPTVEEPAIKNYDEDLPKLKIFNPHKDGRLPMILEGIARLKELCDRRLPVIGYIQGPFRSCTMLRGTDNWMRDIFKKKDKAKRLIEIAVESQIAWGVAIVQAGADIVTIGDPPSSGSCISQKALAVWSLPYLKRVCDAIKKTGAKTLLHICGDISDRLETLASVGADIMQVDSNVDLSFARQVLGPDKLLMGNVDPSDPLALGTPEQVFKQSKRAVEKAGKEGKLLLSGGCMISEAVPVKNMEALVKAGHETLF